MNNSIGNYFLIVVIFFLMSSCYSQSNSCKIAQERVRELTIQYDLCKSFKQTTQGLNEINPNDKELEPDDDVIEICFIDNKVRALIEEINYESGDQRARIAYYSDKNEVVNLLKKEIIFFENGCFDDEIMHYFEITGQSVDSTIFNCTYYTDSDLSILDDVKNCYLNFNKLNWKLKIGGDIKSYKGIKAILRD